MPGATMNVPRNAVRVILATYVIAAIVGCGNGDGHPKASSTAYDVRMLSLLCERLNDEGFDFESVHDIRELREAAKARAQYGKAEFNGNYLLKTPYGNEYVYRFYKQDDKCFVEVSAKVPETVPDHLKAKMKKQVEVRCKKSES